MPRFFVGKHEGERTLWQAQNVTAEGNMLVTFDLAFEAPDASIAERNRAALAALAAHAGKRHQLAPFTWLYLIDIPLNEVFQILVDKLGVDHHSYAVVDIGSGEGLAYDAEKRRVTEFYQKAWVI